MDPGALGAIVFRLTQAAQHGAPMTFRQELRVRPYEPVTRSAETFEEELARLIVAAYQGQGGRALGQQLTEWTSGCTTAERRIDVAHGRFLDQVAAVASVSGFPPIPPPAQLATFPSAAPSARRPSEPPHAPPDPVPAARPLEAPRAAAPEADISHRPVKLSHLLALLSSGPADPQFDGAVRALKAEQFETEPGDRAVARKLLRDRGWYVDTLVRNAQANFDDILVMIFMRAVLPDLSQPSTARELTDWAGRRAAPPRVINALYAACDGTVKQPELAQILGPALAGRWLADNGISAPPIAAAPNRDAARPRGASTPPSGTSPTTGPAPLPGMESALAFLNRKIPVYVALLIAVALLIVVQIIV
jgi:hypothetical protein